jgi:hypothetical protein
MASTRGDTLQDAAWFTMVIRVASRMAGNTQICVASESEIGR